MDQMENNLQPVQGGLASTNIQVTTSPFTTEEMPKVSEFLNELVANKDLSKESIQIFLNDREQLEMLLIETRNRTLAAHLGQFSENAVQKMSLGERIDLTTHVHRMNAVEVENAEFSKKEGANFLGALRAYEIGKVLAKGGDVLVLTSAISQVFQFLPGTVNGAGIILGLAAWYIGGKMQKQLFKKSTN